MTTARLSVTGGVRPLLLAFGLALPLAALATRYAPLGPVSTFEIGNDFMASLGVSFAAIQIVARRRVPALATAWGLAVLGMLAIALEDHLEALASPYVPERFEVWIAAGLWLAAIVMIGSCGRRYAMLRYVTPLMRLGAALASVAVVLNVLLHLFGPDGSWRGVAKIEDFAELAATTTLVAALLLTQTAPMKLYSFAPQDLGKGARALFHDFALETRHRYPIQHPAAGLPILRQLLIVVIILRFMPVAAGAVSRAYGRGVIAQLADLLRIGLAHGVDAKSYYVHELYRAEAGLFDATLTRVETKNGLTTNIQRLRAGREGPSDLNDKLEFFRACEEHNVPSAAIYATVEHGAMISMAPRTAFDRDLFVKDRRGRGGRFTLNFERIGPFAYRADDGAVVTLEEAQAIIRAASADRKLIVQPKLQNHDAISSLADRSLIVFRVMTCLDCYGEPQVTHGVLRLLRRFEPNWPRTDDADWGCAIDIETGAFGLMTGDAPETCTRWFTDHPVTGERITGRILTGWTDIAATALAAHRVFSARVLIGWDIGWTPDGPVILEGNSNPDFSYFQRVSRTPVGLSPLGPLLAHHLEDLKTQLVRDRSYRRT